MPNYTEDDLEHLEESAETARPGHQSQALAFVAGILERNAIAYGVMGGMNFYLRGSGRTTGDVDIAVDNPPRMEALLSIFNSHRRVAQIFVDIRGQLVQLDLKPKGSEGHLIPRDIASSVERMSFTVTQISFQCDMLAIGPLVAAKLKSHYNRETQADYQDLVFIVSSSSETSTSKLDIRKVLETWSHTVKPGKSPRWAKVWASVCITMDCSYG
ncbi:hypothetical protein HYQ45_007088 [Verticillium longisporum]|uniref:Uncharacterized protein n=1 Tax=Verticillium longisporum TaxID=100787 RepID=A0A8I2ZQV8_VERLO|nr:hypothetical protein HYQ45_007088 [Verticillium longisporum]